MSGLNQFTEEIRDFLGDKLTPELRHFGEAFTGYDCPRVIAEEWTGILDDQGWSVPGWPVEHGGTGWSIEQLMIFKRELTLAHAPRMAVQGVDMVGPVVIEFGTDEQKAALLPRIRRGEDWWAQGYSEPGAGSDLASLKCRAVRDGEDYIINGTKIWTTYAHECNKIFCLVRTSNEGKPQAGISFLIFDLDLPGIEIRPILNFGGEHDFNQLFFTDVRVPRSALLGQEDEGWAVAKFLLVGERAYSYAVYVHDYLERIRDFVNQHASGSQSPTQAPALRAKLASVEIELANLDAMEQKTLELMKRDKGAASALASVSKIHGSVLRQRASELAMEVMGVYAVPQQPRLMEQGLLHKLIGEPTANTAVAVSHYFADRAVTIASGTTEIQKNIIATRVLGL
ncbi:MAG: acyl-CoA dehydrogenase family protein [Gammaproteobacteria bacterium]|nr:acyl-CoA dehydrogenase family protein [Gammaproteobacteria bacterium]